MRCVDLHQCARAVCKYHVLWVLLSSSSSGYIVVVMANVEVGTSCSSGLCSDLVTMSWLRLTTDAMQVGMAVIAVLYAYQEAAELLENIVQKRDIKDQQVSQESREGNLLRCLRKIESKISEQYAQDLREGEGKAWNGDCELFFSAFLTLYIAGLTWYTHVVTAWCQLLHVATTIETNVTAHITKAGERGIAATDVWIIKIESLRNSTRAIQVLNQMKQRMSTVPPNSDAPPATTSGSFESTSVTAISSSPAAVKETQSGLARYFSMKRDASSARSLNIPIHTPRIPPVYYSAALEKVAKSQGQDRASLMQDIDDIVVSYRGLDINESIRSEFVKSRETPEMQQRDVNHWQELGLQQFSSVKIGSDSAATRPNASAIPYARSLETHALPRSYRQFTASKPPSWALAFPSPRSQSDSTYRYNDSPYSISAEMTVSPPSYDSKGPVTSKRTANLNGEFVCDPCRRNGTRCHRGLQTLACDACIGTGGTCTYESILREELDEVSKMWMVQSSRGVKPGYKERAASTPGESSISQPGRASRSLSESVNAVARPLTKSLNLIEVGTQSDRSVVRGVSQNFKAGIDVSQGAGAKFKPEITGSSSKSSLFLDVSDQGSVQDNKNAQNSAIAASNVLIHSKAPPSSSSGRDAAGRLIERLDEIENFPEAQVSQKQATRSPPPITPKMIACDPCRKRKVICDGTRPTCRICKRLKHICVYSERRKKGSIKRSYVENLELKLSMCWPVHLRDSY